MLYINSSFAFAGAVSPQDFVIDVNLCILTVVNSRVLSGCRVFHRDRATDTVINLPVCVSVLNIINFNYFVGDNDHSSKLKTGARGGDDGFMAPKVWFFKSCFDSFVSIY